MTSETSLKQHIMTGISPSSTEETNISPPTSSAISTPSNRDLTGQQILVQTQNLISHNIHYAADTDLASHCEFMFNKDLRGDVLILKTSQAPHSEFVLSGIFQIDVRNFFMTSDAKWNSNNPLGTRLDQAKASCTLLPVDRNTEFDFSAQSSLETSEPSRILLIHADLVIHLALSSITQMLSRSYTNSS